MLSGGTESIMKVMGGGGSGAPDGYNETQSVLSGGIVPIVRVEGGGMLSDFKEKVKKRFGKKDEEKKEEPVSTELKETDIQVRYIAHYDFEDEAKDIFKKFVETFGSSDKIKNMNSVYEREIKSLEESNQPLHYISKPTFGMTKMSKSDSTTILHLIPQNTHEIVVLPAVKGDAEAFFKQILFLRDSHYLQITKDKKFRVYNNVAIVILEPFLASVSGEIEERGKTDEELKKEAEESSEAETDKAIGELFEGGAISKEDLLNYLYLKLKKENFFSVFRTNRTVIYPKQISDKNGILFGKDSFPQPKDENDLDPLNIEMIYEKNIPSMIYTSDEDIYDSNQYYVIKNGNTDPDIHNTELSFDVNHFISILELTTAEIPTTVIDMNGSYYKIRLANNQGSADIVHNSWLKGKYTKDETKLIENLDLYSMLQEKYDDNRVKSEIAKFLFYIGLYKCFNDISVLTNNECQIVRTFLKDLYKFKLKHKMHAHSLEKGYHEKGVRVKCKAVDIGSSEIICDVIYRKDGQRVVDEVSIPKPEGFNANPEITEEIQRQILAKWKDGEKPSEIVGVV